MSALVEALGYSGAVRFLRHFTKGEGDYLIIQEEIFKGMDMDQIYERAKEHSMRAVRDRAEWIISSTGPLGLPESPDLPAWLRPKFHLHGGAESTIRT
jgi:hypothetical protein